MIEAFNPKQHSVPAVKELLAMAVGRPDQDYLEKLLNIFYTKEKRAFFVRLNKGKIIGIIGLDCSQRLTGGLPTSPSHPDFRKKGIGRNMINDSSQNIIPYQL